MALIAKRGLCSYALKAKYASKYVYPAGVVQFIIIDGDHKIIDDESYYQEETEKSPASSFELMSRALRKKKSPESNDINVSVLHVTYSTGYDLLELLLREFPSVRNAGGSRLEITGETPSDKDAKLKFIGILTMILMSMSGCLCLISLISNLMESTRPAQQPTARPRRRRLHPWQVRNTFPVGIYDGSHVDFSKSKRRHVGEKEIQGGSSPEGASEQQCHEPLEVTDEACTICLDEYTVGDKLRCLPCQHTFHSKCISKWLTERSATCPLCKVDYYQSDDDEDEEVPASAPLSSSWNSVPPETANVQSLNPQQQSQEIDIETSARAWQRRGRAIGHWGRSLFRRRQEAESTNGVSGTLSEPLLPPSAIEESGAIVHNESHQEAISQPPPQEEHTPTSNQQAESLESSTTIPPATAGPETV